MMKVRVILCIIGALLVHLAVICFGGILFLDDENSHASHQNIDEFCYLGIVILRIWQNFAFRDFSPSWHSLTSVEL